MESLTIDLQHAALDDSIPVSTLLRKALAVATKLGQDNFKKWIESELDGYTDEVPEYRKAGGQIMAWNMYRGWMPVQSEDEEFNEITSKRGVGQSAMELEALVSDRNGTSSYHMPLSLGIQKMLGEAAGFETQYTFFTNSASILGILGAIRTVILKWSLALEGAGVKGKNMSFTKEESQASGSVSQNITIYAPVTVQTVGSGSATAITVGAMDIGKVNVFIGKLADKINEIEDLEDKEELEEDIRTIKAQASSINPKWDKIRAALRSIGSALGKATSSAVVNDLLEHLEGLL